MSKTTLPTIVNDYVRNGKVKLEARTLHFLGPDSTVAAQVAAGAERQGKLWPFLEVFYANQEHGRHLVRFACCKRLDVIDAAVERLARLAEDRA